MPPSAIPQWTCGQRAGQLRPRRERLSSPPSSPSHARRAKPYAGVVRTNQVNVNGVRRRLADDDRRVSATPTTHARESTFLSRSHRQMRRAMTAPIRSRTPSYSWDSFSASAVSPSGSAGPALTRHRIWSCVGPTRKSRFGTTSRCSGPAPWPSVASSRRRGGRALTRILDRGAGRGRVGHLDDPATRTRWTPGCHCGKQGRIAELRRPRVSVLVCGYSRLTPGPG
jgi:hypothetical protein